MKNKKIIAVIGIAMVVVLAGIISWKYKKDEITIRRDQKEKETSNKVKENVKTTKSYRNTTYGYEIEIPIDFTTKIGSVKNPDSLINVISKNDGKPLFSIDSDISKFKNVDSWLDDYRKKILKTNYYEGVEINSPSILSEDKIKVDGYDAIKITLRNMPYSYCVVVFIKDEFIYTISYNGLVLSNEEELIKNKSNGQTDLYSKFQLQHKMELEKMIDSFKFVK